MNISDISVFLRTFESVSIGKPMNAVAELIDVEFPLQFKSGGGCSNVDTDVRVDIWRNQCSNGGRCSNVDNGCHRPVLILGATGRQGTEVVKF